MKLLKVASTLVVLTLISLGAMAQVTSPYLDQEFRQKWEALDKRLKVQDSLTLDMRKRSNGFHHQIKASFGWFGLSTAANILGWAATRIWVGDQVATGNTISTICYGAGIGLGVAGGITFAVSPRWFNQDKKHLPLDRYPLLDR